MANEVLIIVGLFVMGLIIDIVYCLQIQATATFKNIQAVLLTMMLTAIGLGTNWIIIKNESYIGFFVYIIGCGIGTYIATTPSIRDYLKKIIGRKK